MSTVQTSVSQAIGTFAAAAILLALVGCGSDNSAGQAGPSFHEQLETARQEPRAERRARQLMQIAQGQFASKDARGADETMSEAVKAVEEIDEPLDRTTLYTQLASAYARMDERMDARRALREAAKSVGRIEELETRAMQLTAIADVEGYRLKDADVATDILKEAEATVEQIDDPIGQINVLAATAKIYAKIKNQTQAEKLFDQAQSRALALAEPAKRANGLAAIASAMIVVNQRDQATTVLEEATTAAKQIEDAYGRVIVLTNIAEKLIQAEQTARASELLQEADQTAEQIKDTALRQQAQEKLATVRAKLPR